MVSDAENCEPNISEVMLMVQVSIFTSVFSFPLKNVVENWRKNMIEYKPYN